MSGDTSAASGLDQLSVDGLIGWLGERRSRHANKPLVELIGKHELPRETLVELVAIDLIGQRRRHLPIGVEDYLAQFPSLVDAKAEVLDLIDAELCVRRELGETCDVAGFVRRFPDYASEVRQLFFLQQDIAPPRGELVSSSGEVAARKPNETLPLDADDADSSAAFLLQRELSLVDPVRRPVASRPLPETDDSIDVPIPIAPPAWMVGARCTATAICTGGRYWLVKGKDAEHHEAVAMKIIPMPSTIDRLERTRILDLCEVSSSVTHPVWLAPRIAAINNGHLAVVRPGIFGNPLNGPGVPEDGPKRLHRLVRLAFALSSAHRLGATHGGVHRGNLILDHQGDLHLVDVASSVSGWLSYLALWKNDVAATLGKRIAIDADGLCRLLADEALRQQQPALLDLLANLRRRVQIDQPDACLQIGEAVQEFLDGSTPKKSWSLFR